MMSTAIATTNGHVPASLDFSNQQLKMIQHSVMPGANELEFDLFLNLCKAKRLDPLTKQIYAVKVGGKWQTFASIDGLRVIAERSGNYGGQTEPYWCGPDGEWREVWLEETPPAAAKVGVWKRGYEHPTWGVATFKSYGKGKGNNWVSMPDVMLLKCAEALALRKAFPDDLSALYVREEFSDESGAQEYSAAPAPQKSRPAAQVEVVDAGSGEIRDAASVKREIQAIAKEYELTNSDLKKVADDLNLPAWVKLSLEDALALRDELVSRIQTVVENDHLVQGIIVDAEYSDPDRFTA